MPVLLTLQDCVLKDRGKVLNLPLINNSLWNFSFLCNGQLKIFAINIDIFSQASSARYIFPVDGHPEDLDFVKTSKYMWKTMLRNWVKIQTAVNSKYILWLLPREEIWYLGLLTAFLLLWLLKWPMGSFDRMTSIFSMPHKHTIWIFDRMWATENTNTDICEYW